MQMSPLVSYLPTDFSVYLASFSRVFLFLSGGNTHWTNCCIAVSHSAACNAFSLGHNMQASKRQLAATFSFVLRLLSCLFGRCRVWWRISAWHKQDFWFGWYGGDVQQLLFGPLLNCNLLIMWLRGLCVIAVEGKRCFTIVKLIKG